jgi:hypothetical protein
VEGFLPEEFDGADGLGAGLAGDFLVELEMNAILPDVFGQKQFGGFVVKLAELAQAGVIGVLSPLADGQEFEIISERI